LTHAVVFSDATVRNWTVAICQVRVYSGRGSGQVRMKEESRGLDKRLVWPELVTTWIQRLRITSVDPLHRFWSRGEAIPGVAGQADWGHQGDDQADVLGHGCHPLGGERKRATDSRPRDLPRGVPFLYGTLG